MKSRDGQRDIPLSPGMAARLLAHRRDTYGGPKAPVFPSKAGTPLNPDNLRHRVLEPAARSIGMSVEAGRNVKQVAEWLGHADPSFTLRTYVHLMDAGVGDAEFSDEAIGASPRKGVSANLA